MKAVKIIAAIVLSILLLAAAGVLFGLSALDQALSEESVGKAVPSSGIVEEIVDEALQEETVSMGGRYGDMIHTILKTDAMTGFFTEYVTSAINAQINGQAQEISSDQLMTAFSQGVDQVNDSGSMTISSMEEEVLKQALLQETANFSIEENFSQDEDLKTLLNPGARLLMLVICLILCAGLVALLWKSKLGFLWCGLITAAWGGLLWILSAGISTVLTGQTGTTASDQLIMDLAGNGLTAVTKEAFLTAAVFLIIFAGLKLMGKGKRV